MTLQEPMPRDADAPRALTDPISAALGYLEKTQHTDGSWHGDYGGPQFLLPAYVAVAETAKIEIPADQRAEMIRYMRHHQAADGGWGLHVEGDNHMFTSVLNYVALRLLGVPADDPALKKARDWFLPRGGALASAAWGKFILSVLGLYDYRGLNPIPPELWLLPESLPVHPSRLWCHCRMVYLPMSWLYGRKVTAELTPLLEEIRTEIYTEPFDRIDWAAARNRVAPHDAYTPHSRVIQSVNKVLNEYEPRHSRALRGRAQNFVLEQIGYEDRNTDYICIGPINKLYHTLVWYFVDRDGPELARHIERLSDYLYQAEDGLKMQGYNNSRLWDTTFAMQAAMASNRHSEAEAMLSRAHTYLDDNQVLEDVPDKEKCYRHRSKGGWPFSDRPHGWPISDCTAEGLKASLLAEKRVERPIGQSRLTDAVDQILSWQNEDGGWATYELTRGPKWLELLNPSDCFADIMIDYSYVECTSACVQAMMAFNKRYPGVREREIRESVQRGVDYILEMQRADGSWEGSWGVCFSYGTWFGVLGLKAAGIPNEHPALSKAVAFLKRHQMPDGGWGEHARSCAERRWVDTEKGQAVMTSWSLLALMEAGETGEVVERGIGFLRRTQRQDGSWPAEHIAGMFNKTSAIHYDNYLKIFPLWALSVADTRPVD